MKKLFTLTLFLLLTGICSNLQAQLVKEVTLTSANTLAAQLGDEAAKVTTLKISGPLGEQDFKTMKESMSMLQVLDMSGVTELPLVGSKYQGNQLPGIHNAAFQNKQTLQQVIFPECMQRIGDSAFEGCNNLTVADFSHAKQLKQIRDFAFQECSALRALDFSSCSALEELLGNAFRHCGNLQSVSFTGCTRLRAIGEDNHGDVFELCSSLQTVDFTGCSALALLYSRSFSYCSNLTSVKLDGCTALRSIGSSAFVGCSNLKTIDFSQLTSLQEVESRAFESCDLTGDITLPSALKSIEGSAFRDNKNLTSVNLSACRDLSVISNGTFENCQRLARVDLSNCTSLSTLNINAFTDCPSLEEVAINNGFYTSIDGVLFVVDKATLLLYPEGKKSENYVIPSTVITIAENSFPSNKYLRQLTIPKSVLTIKGEAFYGGFSSNGARVIMESPTPIGLSQSIGLRGALVYVPKGSAKAYREASIWNDSKIAEIGADPVSITLQEAGTLGVKLEQLNIPLATIQELIINGPMNANDFGAIKQLEILQKVDLSNASLEDDRLPNSAFSTNDFNGTRLTFLSEVILPNNLKIIDNYAFSHLSALQKVNIPNSVETIEERAFYNCINLQKFDLSLLSNLRYISHYAFYGSSCVLASLELPKALESIGSYAFYNTGVTSVDFSNTSLQYIGFNAFADCPITGDLVFPSTLNSIDSRAFSSATLSSIKLKSAELVRLENEAFNSVDKSTCILFVPKGMKQQYQESDNWCKFQNIVEFGNLIKTSVLGGGEVKGGGCYEKGENVKLKAISYYQTPSFDGWYENGKKISTEPELTFMMGDSDRKIEARFYHDFMVFENGSNVISDANKVDMPEVVLLNGDLTVEGTQPWKPKSFSYYRDASLVVNSDINTDDIRCNWSTSSGYWHFVSFPYDLKMSEIMLTSSEAMMAVREYDGKSRADNGVGTSWKQLSKNDVLKANKGYIIQFETDDYYGNYSAFTTKTGDMKALFNRNSVIIPLNTYASKLELDANWNLVGNPYPSYYSIEQLYQDGLDATVTVWSPELRNYEYYTKDDKDVYLSPLTAFFVQKNRSDLKFSPEGRVANPSANSYSEQTLRSADGRMVINLLLSGEKSTDRTRVVFNENASLNYEIGLDAAKFKSMNQDVPSFYSYDKSGNMLAINERPTDNGKVELGCDLPSAGNYTISLKERVEGEIQLFDKETGATCDLNSESYSFTAKAGTVNGRFELRSGLPTSIEQIGEEFGWRVVDGKLTLTGLSNISKVAVYDAAGHTCYSGKATDGDMSINLPRTGIYFITFTTNSGEQHTCSVKW